MKDFDKKREDVKKTFEDGMIEYLNKINSSNIEENQEESMQNSSVNEENKKDKEIKVFNNIS